MNLYQIKALSAEDMPTFDRYKKGRTRGRYTPLEAEIGTIKASGYVNMIARTRMPSMPGGWDIVLTDRPARMRYKQVPNKPGLSTIDDCRDLNGVPTRCVQLHTLDDLSDIKLDDRVTLAGSISMHVLWSMDTDDCIYAVMHDEQLAPAFDALALEIPTKAELGMPTDSTDCYCVRIDQLDVEPAKRTKIFGIF